MNMNRMSYCNPHIHIIDVYLELTEHTVKILTSKRFTGNLIKGALVNFLESKLKKGEFS